MTKPDTETFVRAVAARTRGFDSQQAALAPSSAVLGELARILLADEREGDTSELMSRGPVDPDAPKVAGPDRPVEP